jgi:hypothetical protein
MTLFWTFPVEPVLNGLVSRRSAVRSGRMRVRVALISVFVLVTLGSHAPNVITPAAPPPAIGFVTYKAVGNVRGLSGRLRLEGAWEMESNDPRFGGLSAIHVEGEQLTAFSDSGWLIRTPLPGRRSTVRAWIELLPGMGPSADAKADRDVEAMAVLGPLAWVILERRNEAIRYHREGWRRDSSATPPAMEKWRANYGAEAMLRLPDGRFLVFSEGKGGLSDALMFSGDPSTPGTAAILMKYRPPAGYRITDAALAPDGRMLLLNRQLNLLKGGFVAKVTAAPIPETRTGAVIEGEEIADLARPLSDNMEGLSVTREGGRSILWMASDNNYNSVQRTLLLKLVLKD